MGIARNCAKIVGLTCLFSGLGLGAMVSAQDDDLPAPPGYVHTGEGFHTGIVKYPTIPLPPDVQGPEAHTGDKLYLVLYKLKKEGPKPIEV